MNILVQIMICILYSGEIQTLFMNMKQIKDYELKEKKRAENLIILASSNSIPSSREKEFGIYFGFFFLNIWHILLFKNTFSNYLKHSMIASRSSLFIFR